MKLKIALFANGSLSRRGVTRVALLGVLAVLVAIVVWRVAFFTPSSGVGEVAFKCEACAKQFFLGQADAERALNSMRSRTATAGVACPDCGQPRGVRDLDYVAPRS
jgi:DNA-directed RNA polymerase subunit RPC12/RpoP